MTSRARGEGFRSEDLENGLCLGDGTRTVGGGGRHVLNRIRPK